MRPRLKESIAALTRWLLTIPAILLILFGCGQAGLASARIPAYADTRSKVRADYAPWPFSVVKPLNPAVYEVIQADIGGELALASPVPGEFWAKVPTAATPGISPSAPATGTAALPGSLPAGSATATMTASGVSPGTVIPIATRTAPATVTPSATATQTRTPLATASTVATVTRTVSVPPTVTSTPKNTATVAVTPTGLVAWWKFDEGKGQLAEDSSGNGLNGTLGRTEGADSSDPSWVSVGGRHALDFDGVDDRVEAPDFDILHAMSISAWVNWDAIREDDGIVCKRTSNENPGNWALRLDGGGHLRWMLWDGVDSSQSLASAGVVTPGVWTHVVITFDGPTTTAKIYINGTLDSTDGTFYDFLADTPEKIVIGWAGQGNQYFDGKIDDVRIYDRVLGQAEVTGLVVAP